MVKEAYSIPVYASGRILFTEVIIYIYCANGIGKFVQINIAYVSHELDIPCVSTCILYIYPDKYSN